jgi:hypothetical protein
MLLLRPSPSEAKALPLRSPATQSRRYVSREQR